MERDAHIGIIVIQGIKLIGPEKKFPMLYFTENIK